MIQQATRAKADGARAKAVRPHGLRADVRHYYETLLCRLPWPAPASGRPLRTLGVTSCASGEGVSTVAAHLALAAAGMGDGEVLLADANFVRPGLPRSLRRPSPARTLGAAPRRVYLARGAAILVGPESEVAGGGQTGGGIRGSYDAAGLPVLLKELAADFGLVVIDLPAAGQNAAALRLAGTAGRRLAGSRGRTRTPRGRAAGVRPAAPRRARPVGVALNKVAATRPGMVGTHDVSKKDSRGLTAPGRKR